MKIVEKLNGDYSQGAVTIAFLGDSVTHGCFGSGNEMHSQFNFDAVYHNRLRQMLNILFPLRPISIINAGIGGDCAKGAQLRLERDVISKTPDLSVVCFGLNDINGSLEDYVNPLEKIFAELSQRGIETIFMTPNMLNTYVAEELSGSPLAEYAESCAEYQRGGRMDKYINAAKECAHSRGIPVADCYSGWKAMSDCGIDTTKLLANRINHPIPELHKFFASELMRTILS